jgi:hypothetical protein
VVGRFPICRLGSVLVALPLNVIFKVVPAFTRVENVGDFVFGCAVDLDRKGWRLDAIGDSVGSVRFEKGDMEYWVKEAHRVG